MLSFKLALRNILGAGLRTWLNVFVLSIAFVVIIWHKGFLDGWDRQARNDMIAWEISGGQLWNENYDPLDPFTLKESLGDIPQEIQNLMDQGQAAPIMVTQGTIYPQGRMQSAFIKGIPLDQDIIDLPTDQMLPGPDEIGAIVGTTMAKANKLNVGDYLTIRWNDINGTVNATEVLISGIFQTNVPTVDMGQLWIPIEDMEEMMACKNKATLIIYDKEVDENQQASFAELEGWVHKSQGELLAGIDAIIKSKSVGGSIFWFILILLAMLAIFDTQILSIFRRQKEIGTYIAMGMTKRQVVGLFTLEGAIHSILAILLGAVYGIPLLYLQAKAGFDMPVESSDFGMAMGDIIYPFYSLKLVVTTILVVFLTTTLVSYWPSRKISKMKPTDALRGKIQ